MDDLNSQAYTDAYNQAREDEYFAPWYQYSKRRAELDKADKIDAADMQARIVGLDYGLSGDDSATINAKPQGE